MRLRYNIIRPSSGFLKDQKNQKVLLVLTYFDIQPHTFWPYLLHFPVKTSIDGFLFETDYSTLNIRKIVFYIKNAIPFVQNWQSAFNIELSRFSNLSFTKTTHLKLLSGSQLTVLFFKGFSDGSVSASVITFNL